MFFSSFSVKYHLYFADDDDDDDDDKNKSKVPLLPHKEHFEKLIKKTQIVNTFAPFLSENKAN